MNFKKLGNLITKTIKGLSENPDDNKKIEMKFKLKLLTYVQTFQFIKI